MKKLLSTITVIAIVGILVAVGFFGYNKYQEVELEKNILQEKQKSSSNSQNTTEEMNNKNNSSENQYVNQKRNNDGSESVTVQEGSSEKTTHQNEISNLKINRDNVFDYLIAGINQTEGGDASLLKFQEPEEQEDGSWKISANNKSGVGSNTFIVRQDGVVEFWDGFMDEKFDEQRVMLE